MAKPHRNGDKPPGWYTNVSEASKKSGKARAPKIKASRARRTEAQRELHNAKLAVAYRRARAEKLFNINSYLGRKRARAWISVAEERLKKAEGAFTPDICESPS